MAIDTSEFNRSELRSSAATTLALIGSLGLLLGMVVRLLVFDLFYRRGSKG